MGLDRRLLNVHSQRIEQGLDVPKHRQCKAANDPRQTDWDRDGLMPPEGNSTAPALGK